HLDVRTEGGSRDGARGLRGHADVVDDVFLGLYVAHADVAVPVAAGEGRLDVGRGVLLQEAVVGGPVRARDRVAVRVHRVARRQLRGRPVPGVGREAAAEPVTEVRRVVQVARRVGVLRIRAESGKVRALTDDVPQVPLVLGITRTELEVLEHARVEGV